MFTYLDNNATTKIDKRVLETMMPYLEEEYGNSSSIYQFSVKPSQALGRARAQLKNFFGANNEREIVFTSGGSESSNMAIRGVINANKDKKHLITTKVEHPCVLNLYKTLEKQGYKVDYIGVDANGELQIEELREKITEETALVSVMWANNETGVLFPVKEIADIVKSRNPQTKFFVDAVQVPGKVDFDLKSTNIDLLAISGHKLHAPKGVGALYIKSNIIIPPLIIGGHQERGLRAGTENIPYIAGLGVAAELAKEAYTKDLSEIKRLRDKLETGILKKVFNAKLNTTISNRVANTTNIGFQYIEGELILLHLSDVGICASSGSACTSGALEPSHVLRAMGVPFTSLHGSIRFSLSRFTTEAEIDYTLEKLPQVIERVTSLSPFQDELEHLRKSK